MPTLTSHGLGPSSPRVFVGLPPLAFPKDEGWAGVSIDPASAPQPSRVQTAPSGAVRSNSRNRMSPTSVPTSPTSPGGSRRAFPSPRALYEREREQGFGRAPVPTLAQVIKPMGELHGVSASTLEKQAFARMQSSIASLERENDQIISRVGELTVQTRCLAEGAIHPTSVITELEEHVNAVEEQKRVLVAAHAESESVAAERAGTISEQSTRLTQMEAELKHVKERCRVMAAENEELREEVEGQRHGKPMSGSEAEAVNNALESMFEMLGPAESEEPEEPAPEEVAAVMMAVRKSAMNVSQKGMSAEEAHDATQKAKDQVAKAFTFARRMRQSAKEEGVSEEGLQAAESAVIEMMQDGASEDKATAAAKAAKAAIAAGGRAAEAHVAALAAAEAFDDCGSAGAVIAGRAALAAASVGYSQEHSMVVGEAASRGFREGDATDSALLEASAVLAGRQAAAGVPFEKLVDRMAAAVKGGCVDVDDERSTRAGAPDQLWRPRREAALEGLEPNILRQQEADQVAATSVQARRWFQNERSVAAAEEAGKAAILRGVADLRHAHEVGLIAARVASEQSDPIAPQAAAVAAHAVLSMDLAAAELIDDENNVIETVADEVRTAAANAAAYVAVDLWMEGRLRFEVAQAALAAACVFLTSPTSSAEVLAAAGKAAARMAATSGDVRATTAAGKCAAHFAREGKDGLVVEAAAAAAGKAVQRADPKLTRTPAQWRMMTMMSAKEEMSRTEELLQVCVDAATAGGKSIMEAKRAATAAVSMGATPALASALVIGMSVEGASAAMFAAHAATGVVDLEAIHSIVASAIVAADSAEGGATLEIASRTGKHAAVGVADGKSLEEVQEEAKQSVPEIPGWSLESWLGSLKFDQLIGEAVLKRVRDNVPAGTSLAKYEQAFVVKLGEHGSVSTILSLLKETPILTLLAEAICGHAQSLVEELVATRKEAERIAREEEEERRREAAAARSPNSLLRQKAQRFTDMRHIDGVARTAKKELKGPANTLARQKTAAEMNEEMKKRGAFTLSYSTDTSLYWAGIEELVGPPADQLTTPVVDAMASDHCAQLDADTVFEVGNYGTVTTSRVEWLFVADPVGGLAELNLDEWPGAERERAGIKRTPLSWDDLAEPRGRVDKRLRSVGEQDVSTPEFYSLRLYTGPLFVKYNGVLRALGTKIPPMVRRFEELCFDNCYATTLHVLCSAILKLGKVSKSEMVYRAPGGALPASFWCKSPDGCQGGLELAFMSTTTAKKEAMAYARRAPGMILFELQQGMVARGASISWLSQYPNEEEILFPPFTALEVVGTRVEGAVVIIQLRPAMKEPGTLKTGVQDIENFAAERGRLRGEEMERQKAAEEERILAAMALASRQREAHWQQSKSNVLLAATQRKAAALTSKLAETSKERAKKRWERAKSEDERRKERATLEAHERNLAETLAALRATEASLMEAEEKETRAVLAKMATERQLGAAKMRSNKIESRAEMLKASLRAKKCAELYKLEDVDVGGVVRTLAEVVGPQEVWKIDGIHDDDMQACIQCLEKLAKVCDGNKKSRKAADAEGVFHAMAECLRRYEEVPDDHEIVILLRYKCCMAISAMCKKAEAEGLQDSSREVMFQLSTTLLTLTKPGVHAMQNITRNHKDNTMKLVRGGGRVDWLAKDSTIVPPDSSS